jgi:hypothetical protein
MNESVKKLITCKWCQSIVDEPVVLPCSETVCRKHSDEISKSQCRLCDRFHVLKDSEQFPANKVVRDLFELKINDLDLGPNHKNASERVTELKDFMNGFIKLREQPDEFVFERFSRQRNKVDLAREKLILEINNFSDLLISKIDSQEKRVQSHLVETYHFLTRRRFGAY